MCSNQTVKNTELPLGQMDRYKVVIFAASLIPVPWIARPVDKGGCGLTLPLHTEQCQQPLEGMGHLC